MKKHPLKVLDVVRTRFKTIAVVEDVATDGCVSLVIPPDSKQKTAWYDPKELTLIGNIKDIVNGQD